MGTLVCVKLESTVRACYLLTPLFHSFPQPFVSKTREAPSPSQQPDTESIIMGVTKETITPGNGVDRPKQGDTITMEYTGNLYDDGASNQKGKQ